MQFETDRARFLGRGRSVANPVALETTESLSRTSGPVLDPIFSLRERVALAPGSSTALAFTTAAPRDRDEALALASRFRDMTAVDRVFCEGVAQGQARLAELSITPSDATLFQRLAAHVIFTSPLLRSQASVVGNRLGQPGLWPHAISGDVPIVLLRITAESGLELARQILTSHQYWRSCGLVADLVVLNDADEDLQRRLNNLVQSSVTGDFIGKPGGVHLLYAATLSAEDDTLLEAAARAILRDKNGSLAVQLPPARDVNEQTGGLRNASSTESSPAPHSAPARSIDGPASVASEPLLFDNGLGGFTPGGREYVIRLRGGERPPAPWSNVLANPEFGCLITEAGGGYTWAGNSQMNRLTPWSNDPVSDPPSEAIYLRDDETGEFWTPTPAPCGGDATTVVRHGQGYTRFTRNSHGLEHDLLVMVSPAAPVKLFHLRVRNRGDAPRRLSATLYAEWVLGIHRDHAPLHVVCTIDPESGALFATSAWAGEFAGRVAFADVSRRPRSTVWSSLVQTGRQLRLPL